MATSEEAASRAVSSEGSETESILRLFSPTFDVDAFLRAHPELRPEAIHRVGKPTPGGQTSELNGANILVFEAEDWRSALEGTLERLESLRTTLADARRAGAEVGVDFAFHLGDRFVMRSAVLGVEDMKRFVALGVDVEVTAYAVGEENGEPDP